LLPKRLAVKRGEVNRGTQKSSVFRRKSMVSRVHINGAGNGEAIQRQQPLIGLGTFAEIS